jgi:anti-sigma factor RsiW
MTEINCESVSIAAMALADGEESMLRAEEIEAHLLNCDRCRVEIEQLRTLNQFLSSQDRVKHQVALWPIVNKRIETTAESRSALPWRLLLLFVIPLFGYKFLTLLLQATPSLWIKLVPIALVIAVFFYLKTNPFKINCELSLKGESGVYEC